MPAFVAIRKGNLTIARAAVHITGHGKAGAGGVAAAQMAVDGSAPAYVPQRAEAALRAEGSVFPAGGGAHTIASISIIGSGLAATPSGDGTLPYMLPFTLGDTGPSVIRGETTAPATVSVDGVGLAGAGAGAVAVVSLIGYGDTSTDTLPHPLPFTLA